MAVLNFQCAQLCRVFDGRTYLVGKAATSRRYRVMDVRMVMTRAAAQAEFGCGKPMDTLRAQYLAGLIGRDLADTAGAPVDFTFQTQPYRGKRMMALG